MDEKTRTELYTSKSVNNLLFVSGLEKCNFIKNNAVSRLFCCLVAEWEA